MVNKNLATLEEKINYTFKDKMYLRRALTHSSYINEKKLDKTMDYERTEFLGDAVLEFVTSEMLFEKYPTKPEGQLTKLRASMVCEKALAITARDIGLGQYIYFSNGEEKSGGRDRDSIIADVVESIIGAIYLDGGINPAKDFIHNYVLNDIENKSLFYDCKTTLQELVQKEKNHVLRYQVISETGPDHKKMFEVEALLDDKVIGKGIGKSKKDAEQNAAYKAILEIKSRKVLN